MSVFTLAGELAAPALEGLASYVKAYPERYADSLREEQDKVLDRALDEAYLSSFCSASGISPSEILAEVTPQQEEIVEDEPKGMIRVFVQWDIRRAPFGSRPPGAYQLVPERLLVLTEQSEGEPDHVAAWLRATSGWPVEYWDAYTGSVYDQDEFS